MASGRSATATMMSGMRLDQRGSPLRWANMALLDGAEQNTVAMLLGTIAPATLVKRAGTSGAPLAADMALGAGLGGAQADAVVPRCGVGQGSSNASWHGKANQLSHGGTGHYP